MVVYLLIILLLFFYKSKIRINGINDDYLLAGRTLPIKGIFVLLVFYRHCKTYIELNSIFDKPMVLLDIVLSQSIVSLFLFYSGYGIFEQIKKKKNQYVDDLPKKRILKLFNNYTIAILSFIIMDVIIGKINDYSVLQILLSFIGWESIGNSNWYIFLTFVLYIIVCLSFKIFKKGDYLKPIFLVVFFVILYSIIIVNFKPRHWMNTSLCFPLGMFFSYYKKVIDEKLSNNKIYYSLFLLLSCFFVIFDFIYMKTYISFLYLFVSILFTLLMIMVTMKIQVNSKILTWLGKYVFWIYILQRIPMIVLSYLGFNNFSYAFFIICFIITIVLSISYSYLFDKRLKKKYC